MRSLLFSTHLRELDRHAAGRATKGRGFGGVELTDRPKGHIRAEWVAEAFAFLRRQTVAP